MKEITIKTFEKDIDVLVCGVIENDEPLKITSERGNLVVLSEDDYNGIKETLYLLQRGMKDVALKEGQQPTDECTSFDDVEW